MQLIKKKPAKTPGEPEKQWSTEDIEAWAVVEITDAEVQVPAGTPLFGPQKYLGANPHLIVTLTVTLTLTLTVTVTEGPNVYKVLTSSGTLHYGLLLCLI